MTAKRRRAAKPDPEPVEPVDVGGTQTDDGGRPVTDDGGRLLVVDGPPPSDYEQETGDA